MVPEADAKLQTGTVSIGDAGVRGDQVVTQIFRLNHENPNNLVAVLRPLISPNNTINANPGNNSLVITDYADNLQRIAKHHRRARQPRRHRRRGDPAAARAWPATWRRSCSGWPTAAAPAAPRAAGGPGRPAARVTVMADPRSNALIVRAANPARMASVRSLVDKLDQPERPAAARPATSRSCYLKNADATKLATVLRAAFGRGSGGGGSGGGAVACPTQQPAAAQQHGGASAARRRVARRPPRRSGHRRSRPPAASSRPTRRPTR